jgi:pimeloyl-ACP methyl ester carboxylesterase
MARSNVAAYTDFFARALEERALTDVTVIGSSVGGWIAAELALRSERVTGLVIINATGIEVPEHPIMNVTGLLPPQLAQVAWHDPSKFGAGAPPMTPELLAIIRANQQTLMTIAGTPYMFDPTLRTRLNDIRARTLVVWGASDKVVTENYGRAFAAAIPAAKFELITEAGHLPQLEQPAETFRRLETFLSN